MIKKIKGSLTIKMFLVICGLLVAISALTYGAIAYFMPVTYKNEITEQLEEQAETLVRQLEDKDTLKEGEELIKEFEKNAQIEIQIYNDYGEQVYPFYDSDGNRVVKPQEEARAVQGQTQEQTEITWDSREDTVVEERKEIAGDSENVVVSDWDMQQETAEGMGTAEAMESADVSTTIQDMLDIYTQEADGGGIESFPVEFDEDHIYQMILIKPLTQVNQALGILKKVIPYIIGIVLGAALLGAAFVSWYLVRPIVRMSNVAEKMAQMNFQETCAQSRRDEIGRLGSSLNRLSLNLSQALEKLQKANAQLKSDIEKEREQEKRRMAFFSAVSHELKTPVTILKGHLQGMLQKVGEYRNRDYYLKRSLDVTENMESMVQEILTVSRMEAAGFSIQPQELDLSEQIRLALAELTELMENKELELSVWIPEHCMCMADEGMMAKVINNLLTNAIRYSPAGAQIRVFLRREDARILCGVENTGVHIPDEALPKLFQAFYRVEESRNRKTGGSGLGLYIVRMIVELHAGGCLAENIPDGVRISFAMPANSTQTP